MTQSAKAQEPSMEEILASIRRIIADDDAGKAAKPAEPAPPPKPVAAPPPVAAAPKPAPTPPPPRPAPPSARMTPPPAANSQNDIDAMLAELAPVKPAPLKPPAPKPAPSAADVLDLTEAMAAPTPPPGPAPSFRTIDGASDVVFTDRASEPEPPAVCALEETRRQFTQPTPSERSLLSNTATAAVDSAFNTLAHTMLLNNARTLEDLVKEMLRPMLKTWLDDNLPGLVERIVRAEIERVSRGRP
jgi:uncharacterized protein